MSRAPLPPPSPLPRPSPGQGGRAGIYDTCNRTEMEILQTRNFRRLYTNKPRIRNIISEARPLPTQPPSPSVLAALVLSSFDKAGPRPLSGQGRMKERGEGEGEVQRKKQQRCCWHGVFFFHFPKTGCSAYSMMVKCLGNGVFGGGLL